MTRLPAPSGRLYWGLLLLIAGLVFIRVAGFDFVMWDDDRMLYLNPHVQGLTSENLRWMFTDSAYNRLYMPLGWLDYAASVAVFHLNAGAHHLVNLALHLINTLLVFAVLRQLLKSLLPAPASANARLLAAFAGALFWGVHPLRVEVVAWVGARVHCFAAVFVLAAVWCYLRAASFNPNVAWKRPLFWAAVLLYLVSLLSLPIALTLPAVFLVLDMYVLRRTSAPAWRSTLVFLLEKIPFALVAAIPLAMSLWGRAHSDMGAEPTLAQFSIVARIMQASYVWIHYLVVTVVPIDLSPVYTRLVNFSPLDGVFLGCFAAVVLISVLSFRVRRRHPAVWAAWLCHLIILVPFLGLTEHPHYASDRYSYLDAVIWSAALAWAVYRLLQLSAAQRSRELAAGAAVAVILAAFGALTYFQTAVWSNSESLFRYVIARLGDDPYRADPYRRLGTFYLQQHRPAEAGAAIDDILQMSVQARAQGRGPYAVFFPLEEFARLIQAGPNPEAFILAVDRLQHAITVSPGDPNLHLLLGKILYQARRPSEALAQLDAAIAADPGLRPDRAAILANWSAGANPPSQPAPARR